MTTKEEYKAKKIAELEANERDVSDSPRYDDFVVELGEAKRVLSQTIDELWELQNNSYPTVPAGFTKGGSTS